MALTLLAAVDGTPESEAILPHAARLAGTTGASTVLLRVFDPYIDASSEFATELPTAKARVRERWQTELEALLARYGLAGRCEVRELPGHKDVSDIIAATARELAPTLIALRSHGTGALRHMLRGSVALDVVARADPPVMVAGEHLSPARTGGEYHILGTTDGSPASRSVYRAIAPMLGGRVRLTLLRVDEGGREGPEAIGREVGAFAEEVGVANAGVELRATAPGGSVDMAIVEAARDLGVDAIACATHGHSAMRHVLAGSVALGVLRRSPVPVLLARSFER